MNAVDIVVTLILVAVIGGAVAYIIKAKKSGQKCVGCPHSKQCGGKCGCNNEKK
ncbi:MAG: FeoB-associated Cys-rich membrane protein [Clostridia bacterium]|nr:FeoB-associated Cys-rich membrane protein [Clostridia bacterium]MBR6783293.1 FeoB-associated Cys-rich membrane protein [Clostridia bacterium]